MVRSLSMTVAAKDLNTLLSRTHDQFDLSMFAQFISLVYAEKELLDHVSCVELESKRIQSF